MLLNKMTGLATYLRGKNIFAAEQLDYWMENGTADYAAKKVGDGVLLCRFQYDAVISVERYAQNASLFLAFLCCWLMENDADRDKDELPAPGIDVTVLDDQLADIEIKVTFIEEITVLPDDQGLIVLDGARYSLDDVSIEIATSVGVGDNINLPTDLIYVANPD